MGPVITHPARWFPIGNNALQSAARSEKQRGRSPVAPGGPDAAGVDPRLRGKAQSGGT
jgi:hypothetical protein